MQALERPKGTLEGNPEGWCEYIAELEADRDGKGFLRDCAEAKVRRLEARLAECHEVIRIQAKLLTQEPATAGDSKEES
jgi:hypothetical protein